MTNNVDLKETIEELWRAQDSLHMHHRWRRSLVVAWVATPDMLQESEAGDVLIRNKDAAIVVGVDCPMANVKSTHFVKYKFELDGNNMPSTFDSGVMSQIDYTSSPTMNDDLQLSLAAGTMSELWHSYAYNGKWSNGNLVSPEHHQAQEKPVEPVTIPSAVMWFPRPYVMVSDSFFNSFRYSEGFRHSKAAKCAWRGHLLREQLTLYAPEALVLLTRTTTPQGDRIVYQNLSSSRQYSFTAPEGVELKSELAAGELVTQLASDDVNEQLREFSGSYTQFNEQFKRHEADWVRFQSKISGGKVLMPLVFVAKLLADVKADDIVWDVSTLWSDAYKPFRVDFDNPCQFTCAIGPLIRQPDRFKSKLQIAKPLGVSLQCRQSRWVYHESKPGRSKPKPSPGGSKKRPALQRGRELR